MSSSDTPMPLGDGHRLSVPSPFFQTSGSGWYLSGSQAIFSVTDATSPGQDGNYQFTGWTGTGTGSYSGTQQSETLTATGPANETANLNFVPNPRIARTYSPWQTSRFLNW